MVIIDLIINHHPFIDLHTESLFDSHLQITTKY